MAVTYGFYDSSSGDRKYNANQLSSIFEGIITSGIFQSVGGSLVVSASSGMTVNVATGRAWFNNTWTLNDATLPLTLDASEIALNRIDRVILEVDKTSSVRANSIKILKGTPASSPVAPTLASGPTKYQYSLADIYVGAGVTSITGANITNKIGTTGTPLITGILTSLDTATLLQQYTATFNAWFADLQNELDANQASNLQNQINKINVVVDASTTIEGLGLVWNSASQLTIEPGVCYAPNGDQIKFNSQTVKSGIALGNSVWGHVYAYLNSTVPTIEVVTTAPVAWKGTAYGKTGDTSRRYLGSVKTDSTGNIYEFRHLASSGYISYAGAVFTGGAPFRCLAGGQSTTAVLISLAPVIPVTSRVGFLRAFNLADKLASFGSSSACSILTLNVGNGAAQNAFSNMALAPNQGLYYAMQAGITTGGAYIDVHGYYFDR